MFTLNCKGRLLPIDTPVIMGIINMTPDSFYEGSRFGNIDEILHEADKMLNEGAGILDIGGQSTRPGSKAVGIAEELKRILPAIESIHHRFPEAYLSVDSYQAEVAREAVAAGADLINDISGGSFDPLMYETIAQLKVPYICMHVKGSQQTMHANPYYDDVTTEVLDYFIGRLTEVKNAGINDVIVDPGFGFSKNQEHNFKLLRELNCFSILGKPVMVGLSRKSTIYKTLNITAADALNGSTVLHTIALLRGANILRVHDVKEAMEAVKLVQAMGKAGF
jgi:dihydropteroate synthase